MSTTVCQIMALRVARNIGIRLPKSTIDRTYDYCVRSAIKRRSNPDYGGFMYQEQADSRTTFPLTAAGVATLNHSGVYNHELISAGIDYLRRNLRMFTRAHAGHYYWWYGNYHASQVCFLAGDDTRLRNLWSDFYWPFVSDELLRSQRADGSWPNPTGPATAFFTAVACIMLQIPNQYLPIFQRWRAARTRAGSTIRVAGNRESEEGRKAGQRIIGCRGRPRTEPAASAPVQGPGAGATSRTGRGRVGRAPGRA